MAVKRYNSRRDLVVLEAISIGTTYLRASFLPEPQRTEVENLLRRYIDVRLDFYNAGFDEAKIDAAEQAAARLQRKIWSHVVEVSKGSPIVLTGTFVNFLNDTIDFDATRLAAMRNRVPGTIWLLLLVVAGCGCWATGYSAGVTGMRMAYAQIVVPLLITVVITVLVDFSATRRGLIGIS